MGAIGSTLGMLANFALGRAVAGLGEDGSTSIFARSGLAGLAGLGRRRGLRGLGAPPATPAERMLAEAVGKMLKKNGGLLKLRARRFNNLVDPNAEGADIEQIVQERLFKKARGAAGFKQNPEKWIKETVTPSYLMAAIENAWIDLSRRPSISRTEGETVIPGTTTTAIMRAKADEDDAGEEYTMRQVSVRREQPALLERVTRFLDPTRRKELEDLVFLGAQALDKGEKALKVQFNGPPGKDASPQHRKAYYKAKAEANLEALGIAAEAWDKRNPAASRHYVTFDAAGEPQRNAERFQRDLLNLMRQMRRYSTGSSGVRAHARGPSSYEGSGVFLSDNRVFAKYDVRPGSEVWLYKAEGQAMERPHSLFFASDTPGRGKASEEAKEQYEQPAREAAQKWKEQEKSGEKQAAKIDRKIERVAERAKELAERRTESKGGSATARQSQAISSFVDNLQAIKDTAKEELEENLSPDESMRRHQAAVARKAVFDAEQMAKRSAAGAERRATARADATGVKGLSAFAGLFGIGRKGKRAKLRATSVAGLYGVMSKVRTGKRNLKHGTRIELFDESGGAPEGGAWLKTRIITRVSNGYIASAPWAYSGEKFVPLKSYGKTWRLAR